MKSKTFYHVNTVVLGILFSLLAYTIINIFIIKMSIIQYFIIEFLLGILEYFCKFTKVKMGIE